MRGNSSMINRLKFSLVMIKRYERLYPQMPTDILTDIIDVVLNRAPDSYFSYEDIQDHPEMCSRCGKCCATLGCRHFNGKTCDGYDSRYDACREFPFYDLNNETGIMLDVECDFALRLAENVLDEDFERNMELLDLGGSHDSVQTKA
jgi:hypothetical protein